MFSKNRFIYDVSGFFSFGLVRFVLVLNVLERDVRMCFLGIGYSGS